MTSHSARRLTRALLLTVLTTVGVTSLASSAYATPNPKISFSDIAFDTTTVDAYRHCHNQVVWASDPSATAITANSATTCHNRERVMYSGLYPCIHKWDARRTVVHIPTGATCQCHRGFLPQPQSGFIA